jgi:hypothetical protein
MLSVITLRVIMLSAIMLSVILFIVILNVIMLNVVMINIMGPRRQVSITSLRQAKEVSSEKLASLLHHNITYSVRKFM